MCNMVFVNGMIARIDKLNIEFGYKRRVVESGVTQDRLAHEYESLSEIWIIRIVLIRMTRMTSLSK